MVSTVKTTNETHKESQDFSGEFTEDNRKYLFDYATRILGKGVFKIVLEENEKHNREIIIKICIDAGWKRDQIIIN